MSGLYDWSGPTPDLAANMTAANMWRPKRTGFDWDVTGPYGVPENTPGGAAAWTTGKGFAPTPPGTVPGYISGAGPAGDRNPPSIGPMVYKGTTSGPQGDKTGPGWVSAAPMSGSRGEATTVPSGPSPLQQATAARLYAAAGMTAPTPKPPPNVPPTTQQYAQKVAAQTGLVPTAKPAAVPPPPASPAVYAQQVAQQTGLIQPKPPAAASTPPPVSVAPATQAPIAPVKPLVTTPQPKPLSNIAYQTTVKPSLYQTVGGGAPRNR